MFIIRLGGREFRFTDNRPPLRQLELYLRGNKGIALSNISINVIARMDFQADHNLPVAVRCLFKPCNHLHRIPVIRGGRSGRCFLYRLCITCAVIVGRIRFASIHHKKPAPGFRKKKTLFVLLIPSPPLLRSFKAAKGIAMQDAVGLFGLFPFFQQPDGSIKQAFVVIGNAKALHIFVNTQHIHAFTSIKIIYVLTVITGIGRFVLAKQIEQLSLVTFQHIGITHRRLRFIV